MDKRLIKKPLVIISIAAAVLLILAGAGYFVWSNLFPPEPPSPDATLTAPPPPPKESKPPPPKKPAPSLEEKIESLRQAIADVSATGKSKEVTLVFTEAEVNDQAVKLLTQIEIPEDIPLEVKGVHIDFQTDNNLVTEAETVTYGFPVTIKVKTQVGVKEGKPDVEITDVSFGFIPLPETVKDRIVALITQKIDELLVQLTEAGIGGNGKVDFEFTEISIQQEELTITAIIKPKA